MSSMQAFIERHPRRAAVVLDACVPLAIVFREEEKEQIRDLLDRLHKNRPKVYILVKFQSISVEVTKVAHKKTRDVIKLMRDCMHRITDKTQDNVKLLAAVSKERQALVTNPHYKSFYKYLETRGWGLQKLVENPQKVHELFRNALLISDTIIQGYEDLLKAFRMIHDKDHLVAWQRDQENQLIWKEFCKKTSKLGPIDRRHLLACVLYSEDRHRKVIFVTKDGPLIQKSHEALFDKWKEWVMVCHPQTVVEADECLSTS
ncbi:MAG: hypothetical protein ACE5OZ_04470 [Candidatus Heimdallarchaeota archaeon]